MMSGNLGPPPPSMVSHFDTRQPMHHDPYPQNKGMPVDNFQSNQQQPQAPQVNVVQRLAAIVKSQLGHLQMIMQYADRKTQEEKNKKERSRSKSRDRSRVHREKKEHR